MYTVLGEEGKVWGVGKERIPTAHGRCGVGGDTYCGRCGVRGRRGYLLWKVWSMGKEGILWKVWDMGKEGIMWKVWGIGKEGILWKVVCVGCGEGGGTYCTSKV